MYIWAGIDVDTQLSGIKEKAKLIDQQIGFKNSCFTLPLHISLKTSFPLDKPMCNYVIEEINRYFASLKPFEIHIDKLEMYDHIMWIRMRRNAELDKVHDELNKLLLSKYNILLHEYDLDYKYHTTLFMSDKKEEIHQAYQLMQNIELPQSICANQFIIGTSETGELGSYKIYKKIIKS